MLFSVLPDIIVYCLHLTYFYRKPVLLLVVVMTQVAVFSTALKQWLDTQFSSAARVLLYFLYFGGHSIVVVVLLFLRG